MSASILSVPTSSVPTGRHDATQLVTVGDEGDERSRADLWCDVARLRQVLPARSPDSPSRVLLVFERDRYAFAVALVATWSCGHTAVVPPDNRRSTLSHLNATCDVVLHDTYSGLEHQVLKVLAAQTDPPAADEAEQALLERWQRREVAVDLHRSMPGTPAHATVLSSAQLAHELGRLQDDLPLQPGTHVYSTAAVQSRYGLVWGILRPLAEGCAFVRSMMTDGPLARSIDTLVTVPYALRTGVGPASSSVRQVISSATPLSKAAVNAAERAWGVEVIDVLSATTTGAIAWRTDIDHPFRALSGLQVGADAQRLRIFTVDPTSAVSPVSESATLTDDLVELLGTQHGRIQFRHLGRADQQISGPTTQTSSEVIEAVIAELDGVADVGVVRAPDATTALICVASREVDAAQVERHLRLDARTASIQTKVKVLPALRRDAQGRFLLAEALLRFGLGPDGHPRAEKLSWGTGSVGEATCRFEVSVPDNYRWFDGHFEHYPVLPAAVQLHEIVLPCVERSGWATTTLVSTQRLKFVGRISPGDALVVRLTRAAPTTIQFEIHAGAQPCSSGRLLFSEGVGS